MAPEHDIAEGGLTVGSFPGLPLRGMRPALRHTEDDAHAQAQPDHGRPQPLCERDAMYHELRHPEEFRSHNRCAGGHPGQACPMPDQQCGDQGLRCLNTHQRRCPTGLGQERRPHDAGHQPFDEPDERLPPHGRPPPPPLQEHEQHGFTTQDPQEVHRGGCRPVAPWRCLASRTPSHGRMLSPAAGLPAAARPASRHHWDHVLPGRYPSSAMRRYRAVVQSIIPPR